MVYSASCITILLSPLASTYSATSAYLPQKRGRKLTNPFGLVLLLLASEQFVLL